MPRPPARLLRVALLPAALAVGGALRAQPTSAPPAAAGNTSGTGAERVATARPRTNGPWKVQTAEHVDLWLHGLAMLEDDTARVPIFRRGYRAALQAERTRVNAYTDLDANRDRLRARLAASPALALSAQFVPLAFHSFEGMQQAVSAFVQAGGDPRRAGDASQAGAIALLASTFPAPADRDWLRLYTTALQSERDRFYHRYWTALQQGRTASLDAADSVWQGAVRPRVQRFLAGTQQRDGTLLLSPVLGGEGRAQTGRAPGSGQQGGTEAVVAVPFPARGDDPAASSYVAVHELVGALVGQVVADNTSPADQRAGLADRYVTVGQVRAGFVLLRRAAPDLAAGYARFYLREAGLPMPNANASAALEAAFPLPPAMLDAVSRQIDVVLGGI